MYIDASWEISAVDVKQRLDSGEPFLLLDVRQPEEHTQARITGAHLLPLPELQERIEEVRALAAGRPIIAHCHHGHRSVQAAAILRQAGLGHALSMAGGIDAWSRAVDGRVPRY